MDQIKIGRFIAAQRKNKKLTQAQLAERLGITDRAVSKWENGKSMPDSSIMLDLCETLDISVNDLLCGEVVTMTNYNEKTEKNLLEMIKQKEEADKRLLSLEIMIGLMSTLFLLMMIAIGSYLLLYLKIQWLFIVMLIVGLVQFIICMMLALRIEQVAGYYKCDKCGHRYVPTYLSVNIAPHMGRTRYMKCPECGKKSWQKKVISMEKTDK